jgi:hypothetical protein
MQKFSVYSDAFFGHCDKPRNALSRGTPILSRPHPNHLDKAPRKAV